MDWFKRLLDRVLLGRHIQRIYRRTYAYHQAKAKREAHEFCQEAMEVATLDMQAACKEAATIRANAKQAGLQAAQEQAQKSVAKDREKALKEGREEGRLLAYVEAATQLGLTPRSVAHVATADVPRLIIDVSRTYPNIYDCRDKWVVRVIINGRRETRAFAYNGRLNQGQQLMQAARFRETVVPADQQQHAALYAECFNEANTELGGAAVAVVHMRAAELFHLRLQQVPGGLDRIGFVGEDPQDRLPAADTSVLIQPWHFVIRSHKRLIDLLRDVGLDEHRTVRDLLLCTAQDLTSVAGFKDASLRRVRFGLAEFGLALWGDPAPSMQVRPTGNRADDPREFRAIDLDDDDE